jgi:hypothetical protein
MCAGRNNYVVYMMDSSPDRKPKAATAQTMPGMEAKILSEYPAKSLVGCRLLCHFPFQFCVSEERMGSGVSNNNAINAEEYLSLVPPEFVLDDLTWIKIFHCYETTDSFSSVGCPPHSPSLLLSAHLAILDDIFDHT